MKASITELSKLTGIDRRRINKALANLRSEKGTKGAILYESTDALPLLYLESGDGENYDLTKERARLAHHQANKTELEAQTLRGTLIAVADVAEVIGDEYANVRARILGLPTRLAPQVMGLKTVAELRETIEAGIFEVLDELTADGKYTNAAESHSDQEEGASQEAA